MELEQLLPSRVTVVTAPAGFGKTERVAALRQRPGTVWVDAGQAPDPEGPLRIAFGRPGRRVLVIDNVHLLDPHGGALRLLCHEIESGSAPTRIALVGRPPIPVPVSAARARGGVTQVTEHDLALTQQQVAHVLAARLDPVVAGLAHLVHDLSAGWPSLVRLAVEDALQLPRARWADGLRAPFERGGSCVQFIEEDILAGLAPSHREVLGLVADLGTVSHSALLGAHLDPQGTIVEDLLRQRLLQRAGGGDGLVQLPEVLGPAFRTAASPQRHPVTQLRRLATDYESTGDVLRALDVHVLLGDDPAIAGLLRDHGPHLLRAGSAADLLAAIDRLPASLHTTEVTMLEAQARQVLGDHDGALARYEALAGSQRELDPALAWRMGVIHYLRGEAAEAIACYRRGRLGDETSAEEAHLLSWIASAAWLSADEETSGDCANRALAAARACGDEAALAAAHMAQALHAGLVGHRRELGEHHDRALEHAERAGDRLQLVRIRANRGSHLLDEGHIQRALADLQVARDDAEAAGFVAFAALCEVNAGEAFLRLGRLGDAHAAFTRAQAIYQRMGSRKIAYALNGLGHVHMVRGALSLARAAYTEALEVSEGGEDVQALAPALCGLARVLVADQHDEALVLAHRAADLPGSGQAAAWLTLGWLSVGTEPAEAVSWARQAQELALTNRDWLALAEALEIQAVAAEDDERRRLLREAEQAWLQSGSALGLTRLRWARVALDRGTASHAARAREARLTLERLGAAVDPPHSAGLLATLPGQARSSLEVRALGHFAIERDGVPVGGPLAQSRKARELFKILLTRGAPVSREELFHLLWPAEEPAALGNRLAVAVSAVRRSLDPDHEHAPDWVLAARGDSLHLDLASVEVDVLHFLSDARAALRLAQTGEPEQAVPALEAALSRYEGDVLADEPYASWADPLRAECRNLLGECVDALAGYDADVGVAH